MSDTIMARGTDSKFKPHPEGQYVGQCVDTIDLGEKVQDFPGTKHYLAPTCALVFRTGEINEDTGEFIDIAREFTVSMGEKANLRKFLEQWRGKPYTTEQIDAGVPLDKLTGNHGLLTVAHRTSGKGRTYANIAACVGIPKQMAATVVRYEEYQRAEYWATKKAEYAEAAAKFRAEQAPAKARGSDNFEDYPGALADEDDDLPF
jgi:hypothetical protein